MALAEPVVPGFTVSAYATVTDPIGLPRPVATWLSDGAPALTGAVVYGGDAAVTGHIDVGVLDAIN